MTAFRLQGSDEGRHLPGTEGVWGESWYHDFASSDGTYGGWLRLGLYPNLGVVWYWVAIVRRGEPLVLISDTTAPCPPRDAPLAVRTDRYETEWTCTEPLQVWRITGRGGARVWADPAAVFTERPTSMPVVDLSFDLEWRAAAPAFPYTETTRYEQASWVQGEVTIGGEHLEVYCPGQRDHSWGNRVWSFPWVWCSGHLPGSTSFHAVRTLVPGGSNFQTGFVAEPGRDLQRADRVDVAYTVDDHDLPTAATLTVGSLQLAVTPELHAPAMIQSPDGVASRFPRSMVRVETPDGRVGHGWLELNLPVGANRVDDTRAG
jgi:hypothetical protein